MKPLKLKISAFGPYAGKQELDFAELKDRSIFLIHGPTGSGKTSILDAICFALYGDTSGADRSPKSMRSDFAKLDELTEVSFDFELKGKRYSVDRIPEQERLKKTGTGTAMQLQEATLYSINENGSREIIRSGWTKVTEEIRKIIGFEVQQFRQVIMLPQGKFRELLTAPTEERQKILEKLFHTEMYKKIEEALKESSKELKKSIDEKSKQKKWHLDITGCETTDELMLSISNNEEELSRLSAEVLEKGKRVKEVQDLLNSAREDNIKLDELKKSEDTLHELENMAPEYDKMRNRVENARRAATLEEREALTREISNIKHNCENNLNLKKEELARAEKIHSNAKAVFENENAREKERENLNKRIIELNGYRDKVETLDSLRLIVNRLKNELIRAGEEKQGIENTIKRLQKDIEDRKEKVKIWSDTAVKVPLYENEYTKIREVYSKKVILNGLNEEMKNVLKSCSDAFDAFQKSSLEHIEEKSKLLELQELWNKGQAAILAKKLEENTPCPVCGSLHHPAPAKWDGNVPTEEDIKKKRTLVERLEKQRDDKSKIFDDEKIKRANIEYKIKNLESEIDSYKSKTLEEIETLMNELKGMYDNAVAKSRELEEIKKSLEDAEKLEKSLMEKLDNADRALKIKSEEYQKNLGILNEREGSIPEEIRSIEKLEGVIKLEEHRYLELMNKFNSAKNAYDTSKIELEKARTSLAEAERAYNEAIEKYNRERAEFTSSLKAAGFEKYQDYENSKMDEAALTRLVEDIRDYDGRLQSARDTFKRAMERAEGVERQDIKAIEEKLKSAEQERDATLQMETSLKDRINNNRNHLTEIQKLQSQIEKDEKKYGVLGRLSEVSNGANGYGITFQRFVLGVLLDDITVAATDRLKLMSRGRYHLRRTLNRARSNAAGGLDLEVFDTYTGIERPVSTLSGGESFLASLSLALGLADVVQAYSGGISLDTIFIDEGFGTLDPESLDFALNTLVDLQKGGRLVGIISHVPELKERIDARLEVIPAERGSTAVFRVG